MNSGPMSLYRAQVTGVNATAGTITIGLQLGGNTISVPHVLIAGNGTTGLHWLPQVGDWLLVGYEPGVSPVVIAAYLDPAWAALLPSPLAPGEVRMAGNLTVTGTLSAEGNPVLEIDPALVGSAPGAATHYMRATVDGGLTWWKIALSP